MDDPRYRTLVYFNTYYESSNVLEDDDETEAAVIGCYSNPNYPLKLVFDTKAVDGVVAVGTPDTEPLLDHRGYIYAYREQVPLEIFTCDKSGVTGTNLRWSIENELRRIVETYPLGSYRTLRRMSDAERDMGGWKLYSVRYVLDYTRVSDDYAPTAPTFTHGVAFTYEGDRVADGAEGTWALTDGGSTVTQTINNERNLYLDLTAFVNDAYTKNGDNLNLSTSTYKRIRFRYKTTGDAKAKIIVGDDDAYAQTVLSETAASTWAVGDVALTTAKTLDHINLHACDGVGTVTYDYVQIYTGNYIIPVVESISPPFMVNDADLPIFGRSGTHTQAGGTQSMRINMVVNLRFEPGSIHWRRDADGGQDGAKDGDYNDTDVFLETMHLGGISSQCLWVWLDLGEPSMQFKARLKEIRPNYGGDVYKAELVWEEYRHGTAASESTSERFGFSL